MLSCVLALSLVASGPTLHDLRDVLDYESDGDLVTRLYPIGFSKGHFAYFIEPADEAVGCYLWEFSVISLVTDKQVERLSWDSGTGDCDETAQTRGAVMRKHGAAFGKLLRKYGVKITAPGALETGEVVHEKAKYTAVLEARPAKTLEGGGETQTFDVVVRSPQKGEKNVGQVTALSEGYPFTWGHRLLGVLRSPVEGRMVVFVREAYRGYEGPPNVTGVKLFGASLRVGFKKP